MLVKLGFQGFQDFAWLGEVKTARWAVIFVVVWGFVGFYMVLFIAAIKGVPAEIYDAARIDGAGRVRMTFSVTIPMIRDSVQTAYIYLGILALDAFVYMQALTPNGGPDNTTLVMSQQLFRTAFVKGQSGYAERDGRDARHRHTRVRGHRVHDQPPHRRTGGRAGMSVVTEPPVVEAPPAAAPPPKRRAQKLAARRAAASGASRSSRTPS